jgi:hypothetical protein
MEKRIDKIMDEFLGREKKYYWWTFCKLFCPTCKSYWRRKWGKDICPNSFCRKEEYKCWYKRKCY